MKSLLDIKTGITMESTSEVCSNHPNRINKPIPLMMIDGNKVCPVCEGERQAELLSQRQTELLQTADKQKSYRVFEKKNILSDRGLLNASFQNYEVDQPEEVSNKDRAVEVFRRYKTDEVFNAWLVGKPGVGKSHLAMSILRNINEAGQQDKSCLFVSVDDMLLRIRNSFNDKESMYTEFYFVDLLSSVDFLVLDDLGAETGGTGSAKKATDFTLRVLYAIANGRQNKSTIITSNLTLAALEAMYDPKLVSRLMKNTCLIRFTETKDKRIKNIDF